MYTNTHELEKKLGEGGGVIFLYYALFSSVIFLTVLCQDTGQSQLKILSNMIIFLWYCPFKIWMHEGRGKQNLTEGKAYLLEAGPSKNDKHWQKTHSWMRNAMVYKIQHREERIFHGYVTKGDIEEQETSSGF